VLKSLVESDPRKTIKELSQDIRSPWSTEKDHLKRLGKKYKQEVWMPHELGRRINIKVKIHSSKLRRLTSENGSA